jgi:hypothetical protein
VVYGEGGFWAIEVQHGATIQPADLSGLRSFSEDYPEATPVLLYRGLQRLRMGSVLCLPVQEFLSQLMPGSRLL